jgi:dienelactone hydrolase
MSRSLVVRAGLVVILAAAGQLRNTVAAQATQAGHTSPPAERLGEIHFPTSAHGDAAAAFEKGVLYLHNFHYPQAAVAFQRARQLDPTNVLAVEFEALTYTHAVWNQQDTAKARAVLRSFAPTMQARVSTARTPRERLWVEAIEALYGGDTPKSVRDTAFSLAVERLHASQPDDPEAATFYALSLLGLNQGAREPRAYSRAEAISDTVLRAHPRHPGALHYKIHAVDEPSIAARGLGAAKQYAAVATDASHALHMTSHIFMPLGMWDDVVRANLQAWRAQPGPIRAFGHGTLWLVYAYLQQGKTHDARIWLDSMLLYRDRIASGAIPAPRGRDDAEEYARSTAASYVINAEAWDTPFANLRFDDKFAPGVVPATTADFFVAYSALRRASRPVDVTAGSRDADSRLADSIIYRVSARIARARREGTRADSIGTAETMEKTLRAEREIVRQQYDSALALFRAAGDQIDAIPFEFGPPAVVKPPRERAAEILYYWGRYPEALAELDKLDKMWPGRSIARQIRARTLLAMGRRDEAAREYARLAASLHDADVAFPLREEALWGSKVLPRLATDRAVRVDTIGYPSGKLSLRGALYSPLSAGKHPALVVLHGSGGCFPLADQDMLGRLFAERGYVTFIPCRRGVGLSAGQGVNAMEQLYREGLDTRDPAYETRSLELLEKNELADVRAAIASVRTRPEVDVARVGVTGVSYGGILSLMSAEADSTLRAAVAFAPAAMNWGWNAPLREYLAASARRTRVPVLVVQAENDWNVGPTRELPDAVRAGGGTASGKLYPAVGGNVSDGHELMSRAPDLWRNDVLVFLDARLKSAKR